MDKTPIEVSYSIPAALPLESLVGSLMSEEHAKQKDIKSISKFFAMYSGVGESYVLAAGEAIRQAASGLREQRVNKAAEETSGVFKDIYGLMECTDAGNAIRGLDGAVQAYERMRQAPSESALAGLQDALVGALKSNSDRIEKIFKPALDGLAAAEKGMESETYWLSLSQAVAAVDVNLSGTGTAIQKMTSAVSYLSKVPEDMREIGRWEEAAYGRLEESRAQWAGKRFWKGTQAVAMVTKEGGKTGVRLQDEYRAKLRQSIAEAEKLLPAGKSVSKRGDRTGRAARLYNALEPGQRAGLWEPVKFEEYVRGELKAGLEAPPLGLRVQWKSQCAVALSISHNPHDSSVQVYFACSHVKF